MPKSIADIRNHAAASLSTDKQQMLEQFLTPMEVFAGQWDKVVLVSCFPTRKIMQKYLALIAWETEAWCEDTPDHMMHFNGSRFMGPYGNPTD